MNSSHILISKSKKKLKIKKIKMLEKKHKKIVITILIILLIVFIITVIVINREFFLKGIGNYLYVKTEPANADIIILLRGGRTDEYSRAIEVAALYKENYADTIYISLALVDNYSYKFKSLGVDLASGQQQLKSILMQLDIPEGKVILDDQQSGGGTLGEADRVKSIMKQKDYKKALIVTNWYHTRRTRAIYSKSFSDEDLEFIVTACRDNVSSPSDWWKHRYEAVSVFEEFPKLIIFHLSPLFKLGFADDPKN